MEEFVSLQSKNFQLSRNVWKCFGTEMKLGPETKNELNKERSKMLERDRSVDMTGPAHSGHLK